MNRPTPEEPPQFDQPTGMTLQSATTTSEPGLPEEIPLTPELLEEEAIRGDVVIRWAVVLLAVLFACTPIYETTTLVHLKTGQYIASHGGLAPSTDVFSYTIPDRPWHNLGWLFDLTLAGVYQVAGWKGLSLLKALLAGVTFWLVVNTSRKEVSTWWGSISAVLALLACGPLLIAEPELITLLGLALTLYLLYHWREGGASRLLWSLPLVFLLWSNLDPRMFLGLALLGLYGVGELLGMLMGKGTLDKPGQRGQFWVVLGVCLLATLANRFGIHALLSPQELYGAEYPAIREYFADAAGFRELQAWSLLTSEYWETVSYQTVAGLVVVACTLVILVLNAGNLDLGDLFVVLGMAGFAAAAAHELPAAALVAAVLGTVNAQQWYQNSFRQTYSVETREMLFSRGGRAVTVIGVFALALMFAGGRLNGADDRRSGLGLDADLAVRSDILTQDIQAAFDDRPFNFTPAQGDLLIWSGCRVFLDSRLGLYHGQEDENLIALHDKTRRALRFSEPGQLTGNREVWRATFERFPVTWVIPRLDGPRPDYVTYSELMMVNLLVPNPDFRLTTLGTSALFHRRFYPEEDLAAYREHYGEDFEARLLEHFQEHPINILGDAFRKDHETPEARALPEPPSFYGIYLHQPTTNTPGEILQARHLQMFLTSWEQLGLFQQIGQGDIQATKTAAALCHLIIRHAHAGLVKNPQSVPGYALLGAAYARLDAVEKLLMQNYGLPPAGQLRYHQIVMALNQGLTLDPDSIELHRMLAATYQQNNKIDLYLRELREVERLFQRDAGDDEELQEQLTALQEGGDQVEELVRQRREKLNQALNNPEQGRYAMIEELYREGFLLQALALYEEAPGDITEQDALRARLLLVTMLLESGRQQEAQDAVNALEGVVEQAGVVTDYRDLAARVTLGSGAYPNAIELWEGDLKMMESQYLMMLAQAPLYDHIPNLSALSFQEGLVNPRINMALFQALEGRQFPIALAQMEAGLNSEAIQTLETILAQNPETYRRPLVAFYLHLLKDTDVDPRPPSAFEFPFRNPSEMFETDRAPLEAPRP